MPATDVVIYAEENGRVPLLEWLDGLPQKVQDKLLVRVELLAEHGHELRRPHADLLRDGIHELRAGYQGVNYRILYFFHDRTAVLSHGLAKEDVVPPADIERAKRRKQQFENDQDAHTYREQGPGG